MDYKERWNEFYDAWGAASQDSDDESWSQMCDVANEPGKYADEMLIEENARQSDFDLLCALEGDYT